MRKAVDESKRGTQVVEEECKDVNLFFFLMSLTCSSFGSVCGLTRLHRIDDEVAEQCHGNSHHHTGSIQTRVIALLKGQEV